ncbi:hypothetical protein GCM10010171_21600 [Actinokineospora fastidiosa]|uniref:Uncharacterized protein n=1 Tax=Actinokineospora fastidiosa TaxID=1816 RepID=A0A918GE92_9PSEU|nr:hypothetical protein GCM10010171_21600 [Actinokineospora fastidiosa]
MSRQGRARRWRRQRKKKATTDISVERLTAALNAADKNELYRLLGLNVRFDKHAHLVEAHADPSPGWAY